MIYVPAAATGQLAIVSVNTKGGLTFGAPVTSPAIVTANRLGREARAYEILPDGTFIGLVDPAVVDGSNGNAAREIRIVLNWFGELKARMQRLP